MAPVYVNNIVINAGADFSQIFSLKDSNSNSAIDLTNYIVASQMRKWTGSAASVTFATVIVDPPTLGQVEISLTSEETSNIKPGRYIYDIVIEDVNGNVTRVYEGMVHVRERATYYGSSNGGSGGNAGIGSVFVIQIGYGCSNPIISIGATIGITSASNAYGARYISTEAPVDPCDGDIWYQPGISTVVGGSGAIIACCTSNFISCNTSLPSITSAENNFFVGCNAGNCITSGYDNNFFGLQSGYSNTTGSYNNFLGNCAGFCNTTGCYNNFFGASAGSSNTTGCYNNFFGIYAGRNNTTGQCNNFFGPAAGQGRLGRITSIGITSSTTLIGEANNSYPDVSGTGGDGSNATFYVERDGNGDVIIVNIAIEGYDYNVGNTLTIDGSTVGGSSGTDDVTITVDTVEGSTGTNNNFLGRAAGQNNTTGCYNNFFGLYAGRYSTDGRHNNFFGASAGCNNTIGRNNNFFGNRVGLNNITGNYNNFFGKYSGYFNTTGSSNNFFGQNAGSNNTTGRYNNFFGKDAGSNNITGSCNIAIGHNVQLYNSSGDNQLAIGVGNSTWIIGNENFNVGIGTNNPSERLEVHGNISINNFVIYGNSNTGVLHSDLSPVTIDSTLSIDEYDSVEYTIRARNIQNVIQTAKVIAVGYGITVSHNQYGTTYVSTNTPLTSYSVDSIDNKFVLISTPTNSEFINYIISFVAFKKYTYIAYD